MRRSIHQQEHTQYITLQRKAKQKTKKNTCIEKTCRVYPSFSFMKQPSDGLMKIIVAAYMYAFIAPEQKRRISLTLFQHFSKTLRENVFSYFS